MMNTVQRLHGAACRVAAKITIWDERAGAIVAEAI